MQRGISVRDVVAVVLVAVMIAVGASSMSATPAQAATQAAAQGAPVDNPGPITFGSPGSIAATELLDDVSCPTPSLCVAVGEYDRPPGDPGGKGLVAWSTNPVGGAATWTTHQLNGDGLDDISCPTESLCVATGFGGDMYVSTNPTGSAAAWDPVSVPTAGSGSYADIDCPTASLCVGISNNEIVTSTNPAGGAAAWTATTLNTTESLLGVSCATESMCLVVDEGQNALTSTTPTDGTGIWSLSATGKNLHYVSCPTASLCVGVGSGEAAFANDPANGSVTWQSSDLGIRPVTGVSCASPRLCAAIEWGSSTDIYTSTDPDGYSWTSRSFPSAGYTRGISCTDPSLGSTICVVVGSSGVAGGGGVVTVGTTTQPGRLRVTTNPPVPSQITVDGHVANTWGLNWLALAPGDHTVCFSDVPGYTTPSCKIVNVVSGQTTTWNATFIERGYLKVTTAPALPSQISVDGEPANNWGLYTDVPVGTHVVCFGPVAGFDPPPCQNVQVTAGNTTSTTGNFSSNPAAPGPTDMGTLRVTTNPPVPSQVIVDGHITNSWGLNWLELPSGSGWAGTDLHDVCFTDVAGYGTPECVSVDVPAGQTVTVEGAFTPNGFVKIETTPAIDKTISIDGWPANNWGVYTDVAPGEHRVCFEAVPSPWQGPDCRDVLVFIGGVTTVTGVYSGLTLP